jgi:hypothetical protein
MCLSTSRIRRDDRSLAFLSPRQFPALPPSEIKSDYLRGTSGMAKR